MSFINDIKIFFNKNVEKFKSDMARNEIKNMKITVSNEAPVYPDVSYKINNQPLDDIDALAIANKSRTKFNLFEKVVLENGIIFWICCLDNHHYLEVITRKKSNSDSIGIPNGKMESWGFDVIGERWTFDDRPPESLKIKAELKKRYTVKRKV